MNFKGIFKGFKKILPTKKCKYTWNDITLRKWYKMQEILEVQDEWTMYNLLDCVYDIDSINMPLMEVKKYDLGFINTKIEEVEWINYDNKKYYPAMDLTKITAAQFVDFQNYSKAKPMKFEDLLSVFIVPKGREYNDGYDMAEVKEDILDMPITFVYKCAFFLQILLEIFVNQTLTSLKVEIMEKMDNNKEVGEALDRLIFQFSE
ncbi:MAG: hypothetical protein II304_07220 [Bacteroidales bacterium]|nr:hypothetical protein [Bacteroidales bacterium]